mmetsp:Transcript_47146/g.118755  ORF Transcript_47146/g.118755 Transcript_47146/m.118755 type:complete len:217 (+) Transcript_47146:740-1390(+)
MDLIFTKGSDFGSVRILALPDSCSSRDMNFLEMNRRRRTAAGSSCSASSLSRLTSDSIVCHFFLSSAVGATTTQGAGGGSSSGAECSTMRKPKQSGSGSLSPSASASSTKSQCSTRYTTRTSILFLVRAGPAMRMTSEKTNMCRFFPSRRTLPDGLIISTISVSNTYLRPGSTTVNSSVSNMDCTSIMRLKFSITCLRSSIWDTTSSIMAIASFRD